MDNVLENLNGNDVLDVQTFINFLRDKSIIDIKDDRLSVLADALDEWSDMDETNSY